MENTGTIDGPGAARQRRPGMARLRWRDQLQTRIFMPIAGVTVAVATIVATVAIHTINEAYEERLTEQLLSQKRVTELLLGSMEGRLSFYARSMADVHKLSETVSSSRMAASIPRTVLESLRHDGMTIRYLREFPPSDPGYELVQRALSAGVATGLVARQTSEGNAYFLEGVATVRQEGDHPPGIMAVDLRLSEPLLAGLRGGQVNLSIVANGALVATTLKEQNVGRWLVERAGAPDVVRRVIGERTYVITRYSDSTPWRRVLLAPLTATPDNTAVLAYDISLEPLIETRRRILQRGLPAAGLGLLAIFAIYALFIRRVTRPLKQLSEATVAVAAGDLDTRLTTNAAGELRILADGFAQMVADLRVSRQEIEEWNRRLEERVAERTRQLQEMQGQLVQAGKLAAIGELAAGLAHELRNPLAVIRMSSNYLARKLPQGEKTQQHVQIVNEEIERIDRLIDDLLEFGRPRPMQLQPTNLGELVEKSIGLVAREIHSRGIETKVSLDASAPALMMDPSQMRQVLINLIINACQAMPNGGELKMRIGAVIDGEGRAEKVRIEVTDTGEGIDPKHLENVFTPFFTTKDSGTGLGLSVSHSIVRSHHGEIAATSRPGEGTTFVITLPVQQERGKDHA